MSRNEYFRNLKKSVSTVRASKKFINNALQDRLKIFIEEIESEKIRKIHDRSQGTVGNF